MIISGCVYIYPKSPSPIETKVFNITPFVKTGFVRDVARDDAADLFFYPRFANHHRLMFNLRRATALNLGWLQKQQLSNMMKKDRRNTKVRIIVKK